MRVRFPCFGGKRPGPVHTESHSEPSRSNAGEGSLDGRVESVSEPTIIAGQEPFLHRSPARHASGLSSVLASKAGKASCPTGGRCRFATARTVGQGATRGLRHRVIGTIGTAIKSCARLPAPGLSRRIAAIRGAAVEATSSCARRGAGGKLLPRRSPLVRCQTSDLTARYSRPGRASLKRAVLEWVTNARSGADSEGRQEAMLLQSGVLESERLRPSDIDGLPWCSSRGGFRNMQCPSRDGSRGIPGSGHREEGDKASPRRRTGTARAIALGPNEEGCQATARLDAATAAAISSLSRDRWRLRSARTSGPAGSSSDSMR